MPLSFSRSIRALEADRHGPSNKALIVGGVLLAAWSVWFFLAKVDVVESATVSRLELLGAVSTIEVPVEGRVRSSSLVLGKHYRQGDVMATLDSSELELQIARSEAERAGVASQVEAIRRIIDVLKDVATGQEKTGYARVAEAQAKYVETLTQARAAEREAKRLEALSSKGVVTERQAALESDNSARLEKAAVALQATIARASVEQSSGVLDVTAEIAGLEREIAQLTARANVVEAELQQLAWQVAQRTIRAPGSGRLARVSPLQIGAYVQVGDDLGVLMDEGVPVVAANFDPARAVGRIREGHKGWIRLAGFPWTQYGMLEARVTGLASETSEGLVRVELEIVDPEDAPIPLLHGMPATVEVVVEQISPAQMVLRAAGELATDRRSAGQPGVEAGEAGGPRANR